MFKLNFIYKYLTNYIFGIAFSILLSFLAVVLTVFTFSIVMPFLLLLFNKIQIVEKLMPFSFSTDAIKNNFYYLISEIIRNEGKQRALLYLSLGALVLYFLKNLFTYSAAYFLAPVRNGVLKKIRNDIYIKLLILPLGFYRHNKKGDIISRATNDVQELDESIMKPLQALFVQTLTIIFYLSTLFIINYKLTIFVLILLPVGAFIISRISKKLKKTASKLQSKQGYILSLIEESISGLRVIKGFNAIDFSNDRFRKSNDGFTRIKNIIYRRTDLASPLSEFLGTTIVMIILLYGGSMILSKNSSLNAELFILYLMLFITIIPPAKDLTTAFYFIQKGKASIERITFILDAEEVIVEKPFAHKINSFQKSILFKDVCFSYDIDKIVLNKINLEIEHGKSVAIVGPSGAGKSTLVDLIPRFYDCTNGELLIDEFPIKELAIEDVRKLCGIVSQDTILFNDTVFNNIAFGNETIAIDKVIEAAKIANAHDFIMQMEMGYDTLIGDRGSLLSGGQRQRINIARAVLKNPPILILDEATSALDMESEHLVQEALEKIMKGRTTIAIAHRLSTIYSMDEIIVLDKGNIVERGSHNSLIAQDGLYKKLHDMQSFK
ncbi:MAG: ABC transporter ATP-binding protein [Bacteroidetes bacterium]|nr:ABC transporter ATP-binding protein [Bacteroidota bacterium]